MVRAHKQGPFRLAWGDRKKGDAMPKKTINHEDSLFSIQNDATEPHLIDDEFVDMNVWPFNKKEKHK